MRKALLILISTILTLTMSMSVVQGQAGNLIEAIIERGTVRCGVNPGLLGFAVPVA